MSTSSRTAPIPIIYDGDMGGDDIWAIMMMLAHPEAFEVKGITTVFGNVDCNKATKNIISLLSYANINNVSVYKGLDKPLVGAPMFGDGAYGDSGIGGVVLPVKQSIHPNQVKAVNFIVDTLKNSEDKITIFGTGPTTNIATAIQNFPEIIDKIEKVIIMGGAINPGPTPAPSNRIGNITLTAEFNFFQDPYAANAVLQSGVPVDILTMDANQHIHFDPATKEKIRNTLPAEFATHIINFLAPAENLDRPKFGVDGAFIHDPNVIIYALAPHLYCGRNADVSVEIAKDCIGQDYMNSVHGKMNADFTAINSNIRVIEKINNPAGVLSQMVESLNTFAVRNFQ